MKWMDQINEEIKSNGPSIVDKKEIWEKHSIYKIPSRITELNKNAYIPQTISFGPYHYGEENLKAMEEHKHRTLVHFLKRCKKPIELVFQRMVQVVQELRDSYNPLDPIWISDTSKFVQMMILDGCFILEILRANTDDDDDDNINDYAENDPVFGKHKKIYVLPYIKRDMLMLENQIPMRVLYMLIQIETDKEQEYDLHMLLNKKIVALLNQATPLIQSLGKCMHILDVYKKSLIQEGENFPTPTMHKEPKINCFCLEKGEGIIRSAMELHEAGVGFTKSKTLSLRDVSFHRGGHLSLPKLIVDDETKYKLLNLVAFELLHDKEGDEVTSFISFMDDIIDNEMDVALLKQNGILINYLGSDKVVSELFISLSKEIIVDDENGVLGDVRRSMNDYCKKPCHRWRASLTQTYFRNPWAIVGLLAAIFLFALTIVQTIYSILQYY